MITRSFTLTLVLFLAVSSLPAQVSVGTDSLYSPSLHRTVKVGIILPATYGSTKERYETLYLLHGFEGSYEDWITRTRLVALLSHYSLLVVTPDAGNSWYVNGARDTTARYEDYIMKDLIPFIDGKYRTIRTRHGRMIAGLSMGGYGAMRFALKYPAAFRFAASLSGSLYVPAERSDNKRIERSLLATFGPEGSPAWKAGSVMTLAGTASPATLPYLFLSTGNQDVGWIVDSNRGFVQKLREKGIAYEYHELPGKHSWLFWDQGIGEVLKAQAALDISDH